MPDFEALIRHQQLKQPTTNQRLKVVDASDIKEEIKEEQIIQKSNFLVNLIGGFIGSIIGTLSLFFLYVNEFLPMDLLKLK